MILGQWNEAFFNRIKTDIMDTIINDCTKLLYEEMRNMIYKTVYNEFSPVSYNRRYDDGGLGDISLYDFDLKVDGNGFTVRMFTNVEGAGFDKGHSLDKYICEGVYQYPNSPKPRDFYQATLNSLIDGGVLDSILREKLGEKGINIK